MLVGRPRVCWPGFAGKPGKRGWPGLRCACRPRALPARDCLPLLPFSSCTCLPAMR